MRKVFFILILLTGCGLARAQETEAGMPVRVVFTSEFQGCPFSTDPVWGGWREGSLARAMSYIRSHRRAMEEGCFALVECSGALTAPYSLYPEDFSGRIGEYCGYGPVPAFARVALLPGREMDLDTVGRTTGADLVVAAFGVEPEVCRIVNIDGDTVTVINLGTSGRYIGVVDFHSATDFTAKTVDISGFPVDAEYEEHFKPLADDIRAYFNTPIVRLAAPAEQAGFLLGPTAYTGLFHRFQLETGGAKVSFFAAPRHEEGISAGDLTFRDILRRFRYDNRLVTLELTGDEIRRYLEYAYGLRYNTMRRSTDDLVRMTRDRDGILQTRTAVYNLDEAGGINYEVDVTRPQGRRIRIRSLADGTPFDLSARYAVAVNSHRLTGGTLLTRATGLTPEQIAGRIVRELPGDYRALLRDWLAGQGTIVPENPANWRVIPKSFVKDLAAESKD